MHFAWTAAIAVGLTLIATGLAPLWSGEVLRRVEFLLTFCEGERSAAVAACDLLISHTREREEK